MTFELFNGFKMPSIGIGSYAANSQQDKETLEKAIVEIGYRHIDTASHYHNEQEIGDSLQHIFQTTSIQRADIFITTKLWCDQKNDVVNALQQSLKRLKTTYVDLYLIHWPVAFQGDKNKPQFERIPLHVTWKQMEECVHKGLARSIGVANFNFQLLNDLLTYAQIRPACNQLELYPYLSQTNFLEWMQRERILPIGYSPLGRPYHKQDVNKTALLDPVILNIADKHQATPAQVLLAWGISRGYSVIPKTSSVIRSAENFKALKLNLSKEDIQKINQLNRDFRTVDNVQIPNLMGGVPMFE